MGARGVGLVKPIRDRSGHDTCYPLRCARAAVREATAWGAELLVIKGDITDAGRPEEWAMFDELLADIEIPVMAVPGSSKVVSKNACRGHISVTQSVPGACMVIVADRVPFSMNSAFSVILCPGTGCLPRSM